MLAQQVVALHFSPFCLHLLTLGGPDCLVFWGQGQFLVPCPQLDMYPEMSVFNCSLKTDRKVKYYIVW